MYTDIQREASNKIGSILEEVEAKLKEATRIAREADISFHWDGPVYGMGGEFDPDETAYDPHGCRQDGWLASSNSC